MKPGQPFDSRLNCQELTFIVQYELDTSDFITMKDIFQNWQVKFESMMRVTVLKDEGDSDNFIDVMMVTTL